jgi:hypothetical protein
MRKARKDDEYQPDMPPVDAEYLLAYLFEIGPTMAAGGYPGPITNAELDAWCNRIGLDLQPWESRFLCRLSREYLNESHRAEKPDCSEPARQHGGAVDLSVVAKSMQQALKDLANL